MLYNITNPFPLSEKLLCYFARYLAEQKPVSPTIKVYLAAAQSMHISLGFPDLRDTYSLPLLERVQAGIKRVQANKRTATTCIRLPMTPANLNKLRTHWEGTEHPERLALWAASTPCFAGFFRSGKLLPITEALPSTTPTGIQWGKVMVDNPQSHSMLKIRLPVSKCDQFGKRADMYVGKTNTNCCPMTATVLYMASRGHSPGPFFPIQGGKPLSKPQFVVEVRKGLMASGLNQTSFAGHSFHIGAATAVAQAGIPDSAIQTMGRWSSAAFILYIRTPRQQLASVMKSIM